MFSSQLQPTPGDGDVQLDVSSIGRTNILHSEEEELYIRNVLLAAQEALLRNLDSDLQRKEETVDLIDRCRIALAPHKRLPPEVLRSIFHYFGETRIEFPPGPKRRDTGINQDLRLLHICSAWRQLALEIPVLWSDISIYLSDKDWKQHHKTLSSARQWFDRAQDAQVIVHCFQCGSGCGLQPAFAGT